MKYETIVSIQYKKNMALCGTQFSGDDMNSARKFASSHNVYHAAIEVWEIDESAAPNDRNRRMISSSPFPFQVFGEWKIAYYPNNTR